MMTFEEFWYDYKVKNGLSGLAIAKMEIARDAWFAGQAQINEVWNQSDAIARPEEAKLSELVPTNWLDPLLTGPDAVLPEVGKEVTLEHVAELLRRLKKRLQDAESRGNG